MFSTISGRLKRITLIDQLILIWLVIVAFVLNDHISNENDVLPFARHFIDQNWLSNDWYLDLNIEYRIPFDIIFGSMVFILGFQWGAILGRLLVYFLLAIAMRSFCQALGLRFWIGFGVLLFFLNHQSLVAGEWIVGGVDTKTIAYALVILSCSAFIRKRYLVGFAFAGAAMSFHALVGAFAVFCILFSMILTVPWRSEWHKVFKSSWPFLLTGFWGLFITIKELLPQGNIDTTRAWEIYVQYRVPHHVLPSAWTGDYWVIELVLAISLCMVVYIFGRSSALRFIAAYALGSALLFIVGIFIYMSGNIELLRFYWFRFPDVMIPLLSITLIAMGLNNVFDRWVSQQALPSFPWHRTNAILLRLVPVILILVIIPSMVHALDYDIEEEAPEGLTGNETLAHPMFEWIEGNTPETAVFLVDPTMDDFYVEAQRAMFVSFKHSPQSSEDILEWYQRIELCNGSLSPDSVGYLAETELQVNFYNLDESSIRQIANMYGVEYYLGSADQTMGFELVYSTADFTLYKIR